MLRNLIVILVGFSLLAAGCGGGEGSSQTCVPGAVQSCPCSGGGSGTQVCAVDGKSFGPCQGCGKPQDAGPDAPIPDAAQKDTRPSDGPRLEGPLPDTALPEAGVDLTPVDGPLPLDQALPMDLAPVPDITPPADQKPTPDMAAIDLAPIPDTTPPADQTPTPDMTVIDAWVPDQAPPAKPVCTKAKPLTLVGGKAWVNGEILAGRTDNDVNLPSTGCTSNVTPGPEDIYAVQLKGGVQYLAAASTQYYGNALYLSLYTLASCAGPAWNCLAGADPNNSAVRYYTLTPPSSGTYYMGIDSRFPAGNSHADGVYSLTVEELSKISNNTCSTPQALTWKDKIAAVSSHNLTAQDAVNVQSFRCPGSTGTPGADLFYKVAVTAGKKYAFTLTSSYGLSGMLYLLKKCAVPYSTHFCISYGSYLYTAPTTGDLLFGMDSAKIKSAAGGLGMFTVEVEELAPPDNDTCVTAAPLKWIGDTASAAGDVRLATRTVSKNYGPDVFFKVAVDAGTTYKLEITPDPKNKFVSTVALLPDCNRAASRMTYVTKNTTPSFYFTPTKTGDQYIIVEGPKPSSSSTQVPDGKFTISVTKFKAGPGDSCQTAQAMSWSGSKASATGNLYNLVDTVRFPYSTCCYAEAKGHDQFFSLPVTAAAVYKARVVPSSNHAPALYLLDSCKPATCRLGVSTDTRGAAQELVWQAGASGTATLGVDSISISGSAGHGPFTLDVEKYSPAPGDFCDQPTLLNLGLIGSATVKGSTSANSDALRMARDGCAASKITPGRDRFYKFNAVKGTSYRVEADSPSGIAVYVFDDCADPRGSCKGGAVMKYSSKAVVQVGAEKSGPLIVGIDSDKENAVLSYTLSVSEILAPANDFCSTAQVVSMPAGYISIKGNTDKATATVNLGTTNCTGNDTEGVDLFYKLTVKAGTRYAAGLSTGSQAASLYLFESCSDPGGSCLMGGVRDSWNSAATLYWVAAKSGDVYLGVDSPVSYNSGGHGAFTLSMSEGGQSKLGAFCDNPTPLTFTSGLAKASGDTTYQGNYMTLPANNSCTATRTEGKDRFYSFPAVAGKTYTLELTPDSSFDAVMYVLDSCSPPMSPCLGGANQGSDGDKEVLIIKAQKTGTLFVAVDAERGTESGSYSLTITES